MSAEDVPPGNSDIPTHRLKAGCSASELRGQMPDQKRCGTCQKSKPRSDFNRKAARSDGRTGTRWIGYGRIPERQDADALPTTANPEEA